MKTKEKFLRTCSVTHEGMNKGWCWGDGTFYTKYEGDTLRECVEDKIHILAELEYMGYEFENEVENEDVLIKKARHYSHTLTPKELLSIAYGIDYLYWTEWTEND